MGESPAAIETEALPPLYQRWADAFLAAPIPRERVATCSDCAMCTSTEHGTAEPGSYERTLKCCTYFPRLPNFLVGRALDVDSTGAAQLRRFIADQDQGAALATLLGVRSPLRYSSYYAVAGSEFGRDPALLCPYAIYSEGPEGSRCGIWQYRNAVCSTYFCKHVRGRTGQTFWESFRNLLNEMEVSLAWWAVAELIPQAGELMVLGATDDPHTLELPTATEVWGFWPGSREDYYRACAERVESLRWDEALAISGAKATIRAREVLARFKKLSSDAVPTRARVGPYQVLQQGLKRSLVHAPGGCEAFQLPSVLLPLLSHFDGRPTDLVLAEIKERSGVGIAPDLVRKLCDFNLLHPVADEGDA